MRASELAAIAGVTEEKAYDENEDVIKQNSVGETVFLIIEGQVSVEFPRIALQICSVLSRRIRHLYSPAQHSSALYHGRCAGYQFSRDFTG